MKIVVTGANGQLGQCLKKMLELSGGRYKNSGVESGDDCDYTFLSRSELDITDKDHVKRFFKENEIDIVINCAAYTNVDRAEDDKEQAYNINYQGVNNLASALNGGKTLLIHISTDYVFDGKSNVPYSENDAINPIGVYGASKADGEKAIAASGCNYIIIRTSWLYSEFGTNFLKTIIKLLRERESINVVIDQVGTPTLADDLADAILRIIAEKRYLELMGEDGKIGEIFHYSNLGVCTWFDFATEIKRCAGLSCSVKPCSSNEFKSRVTRPSYSVLDKRKFCNAFKIDIPYWRESLTRIKTI